MVPLFVSLASLKDPATRVMEEVLSGYGVTEEEMQLLKAQEMIVVLDGYDELKIYQNIYQLSGLNSWNVKVVITCRTSFLFGGYSSWFAPLMQNYCVKRN